MEGDIGRTIEEGFELFHSKVRFAFHDPPYKINSTHLDEDERRGSHGESINSRFQVTDPGPPTRHINFFPTDEFLTKKNESLFDKVCEQAFDYAKELFNSISENGLMKNVILWNRIYR